MATSQRLQQDYLTCTLCSQPFSQPKTLPCLHNFCKKCLSDYLVKEMSGGKHSTFLCPECKKKIYVPDPGKAVNRWAAQFPTNFMLSGMLEAIAQEGESRGQGSAMVRAAKERRGAADIHETRRHLGDSSPKGSPQLNEKRSALRKTISGDSNISMQLNDVQARLTMLQTVLQKDNKDMDHTVNSLRHRLQDQKLRLEKSFEKVYILIEGRKAQLLEELDNTFVEEQDRIAQSQQSFTNDLESVNSCMELLKSLDDRPVSDEVLVDMLDAIMAQLKEIEARPPKVHARDVRFEQTLEAGRSVLQLIDHLGHVTITMSGESETSAGGGGRGSKNNLTSVGRDSFEDSSGAGKTTRLLAKPKFLTAVRTKSDDGKCQQIYDIDVMPNGTIVMTSLGENIVQAAKKWGDTYKITGRLQLDTQPKCIASVSPFYVGVVGISCVYIIAVDDKLTLKKTVHTGKDYMGIAAYTETSLILSCQKPPCIDFVGLNGLISETIDRDHTTGTMLLKNPQFIASSKEGVIYATDASRVPRVLSVNNAGKLLYQYPSDGSPVLKMPQGVCCDSQGHLYVIDRGERKVILLSPSGEKIKDLLTEENGITDPCGICVDKDDVLYVTNNFTEIMVFQTK
ncbi:tripartite motif-containing protein 2 [Aplysia californica]|uniref:Tripartite motif-containing protein 2 n=1 Tax=Aplysia californica TaxID=6500 RepID=A0ABM0K2W8_APLCA|nr:tripartite motif-containing protein 2 [Aplysia californica]